MSELDIDAVKCADLSIPTAVHLDGIAGSDGGCDGGLGGGHLASLP
jgi:hypothetical protein